MVKTKYVNERFFDSEGKTPEQLKAMWYVLGISFAQYSSQLRQQVKGTQHLNRWQSSSKDLVGIVKSCLESEHAISTVANRHIRGEEDFTTYYLKMISEVLYESLHSRGLGVPKEEREFPHVEEQYLDHFLRGFFDARVRSRLVDANNDSPYESIYPSIEIYFNVTFLKGLYATLVGHAHVKGGREVEKSPLVLGGTNVQALFTFMYRDWEFITEHGLYLPSRKEVYDAKIAGWAPKEHPDRIAARQRIERAKELLLKGIGSREIAELLRYSQVVRFNQAFRGVTGKTITQFLEENAGQLVT